jgi:NADH:ubiquinone oxidoreductase subunit H
VPNAIMAYFTLKLHIFFSIVILYVTRRRIAQRQRRIAPKRHRSPIGQPREVVSETFVPSG